MKLKVQLSLCAFIFKCDLSPKMGMKVLLKIYIFTSIYFDFIFIINFIRTFVAILVGSQETAGVIPWLLD